MLSKFGEKAIAPVASFMEEEKEDLFGEGFAGCSFSQIIIHHVKNKNLFIGN